MAEPMSKGEMDQLLAKVRDELPSMWWALFEGCKEKGFTEEQSLRLVMAWIRKPA